MKNNLETKIKKAFTFIAPVIFFTAFMLMLSGTHFAASIVFAILFCISVSQWWKTFAENKYDFVSEQ
jgi:uncharacterized membrane protein YagU involved in acid resistance